MESTWTRPKSVNVVKPASWQYYPVLSPGEAQKLVLGPRERKIEVTSTTPEAGPGVLPVLLF